MAKLIKDKDRFGNKRGKNVKTSVSILHRDDNNQLKMSNCILQSSKTDTWNIIKAKVVHQVYNHCQTMLFCQRKT